MDRTLDVAILGGGPAGAAAARVLAGWGYAVAVLTKRRSDLSALAESLPPSCHKLLSAVGLADAVAQAGFYPTRGNTVWWGDAGLRSHTFGDGALGYQVERRALEETLLAAAESAGATVRRGAVRHVELDPAGSRVVHEADGIPATTEARAVLDCSGRTGVVARRGFRLPDEGRSTVALVGVWRRAGGWDVPDASHTLVESYADGWGWSVPVSDETRYVTVMVDPRTTRLNRDGQFEATYRAELAKTHQLARRLAAAELTSPPWALDASLYTARQFGGPAFLLVGDAASFIDPLSSFGVKKALASAWLAAVVTHTRLSRPDMAEPALAIFTRREREMYETHRRLAASFFADGAAAHRHPFWDDRAELPEISGNASEGDVKALARDPDVQAAFEALKQAPRIRLRSVSPVPTTSQPAVIGREVVLERRLVVEGWTSPTAGVRFLCGVDLLRLIDLAAAHTQVPDLFEAYQRVCPPVGLPDFLGALSMLLAKGVLRNEAE